MKTAEYKALEFAKGLCENDCGGHDYGHIERVFNNALRLAEEENADSFVCGVAAALHDADDRKLSPQTTENKDNARRFLRENGVDGDTAERIVRIIDEVSFRGTDSVVPSSLEGNIVQDADRLDAIGAIGVARCFAYGGSKGRKIYESGETPILNADSSTYYASQTCSINHFYEKLLLLKDMMNTASAKKEAERRHDFLEAFLREFFREIK